MAIDFTVPRLGPPVNLRKGGPHKGIKDIPRSEQKRRAIRYAN